MSAINISARALCTICVAVAFAVPISHAIAQRVTPRALEVPVRFATIQMAIDSARNGDSIVVAPGIYRENIRLNGRNVALVSRFGRSRNPEDILNTVIAGRPHAHPDSGTTVLIVDNEDTSAVVEGFTIIGGAGTVWYDAAAHNHFREGGAILCDFAAPTIRHNRILGGRVVAPGNGVFRSSGGGGIRCGYAEPTIEGNFIAGNRARYGAGLVLFHSAAVTRHNIFARNVGGEDLGGGAAWIIGNFSRRLTSELRNNSFVANAVVAADSGNGRNMIGKGGGALLARVNAHVTDNLFIGNMQPAVAQLAIGPGVVGIVRGNAQPSGQADSAVGAFQIPRSVLRPSVMGAMSPGASRTTRAVLQTLAESRDSIAFAIAGASLVSRRAELLAADSVFGRVQGTGIALRLTAPLADDALVIGPGTTLWRSAAATRTALLEDTAGTRAQIFWAPIKGDVSVDGNEGYTFGFLSVVGGMPSRRDWKYLAYWRRDASGSWHMIAHKRLPRSAGPHADAPPTPFRTPTRDVGTWYPGGTTELSALLALDSTFSRTAQLGAEQAFLAYTAREGATLGGDADFAWGPQDVAKAFAQFAPGTIEWVPDAGHVARSSDLGFTTGVVVIRDRSADGTLREIARARYFTIWQRDQDGRWKLIIDG